MCFIFSYTFEQRIVTCPKYYFQKIKPAVEFKITGTLGNIILLKVKKASENEIIVVSLIFCADIT